MNNEEGIYEEIYRKTKQNKTVEAYGIMKGNFRYKPKSRNIKSRNTNMLLENEENVDS